MSSLLFERFNIKNLQLNYCLWLKVQKVLLIL